MFVASSLQMDAPLCRICGVHCKKNFMKIQEYINDDAN
jgi:hypothetical protein